MATLQAISSAADSADWQKTEIKAKLAVLSPIFRNRTDNFVKVCSQTELT